jgi:hypothetical protein
VSANLQNQGEYMRKENSRVHGEKQLPVKVNFLNSLTRECLPVFFHDSTLKHIHVFHFLSCDDRIDLVYPRIPLSMIVKFSEGYCKANNSRNVNFLFHETQDVKFNKLKQKAKVFLNQCSLVNGCEKCRAYNLIKQEKMILSSFIQKKEVEKILKDPQEGKLFIFDQLFFNEEDKKVVETLVQSPKTDCLFVVSLSTIDRFKKSKIGKQFKINCKKRGLVEIEEYHNEIKRYFRSLISKPEDYYLHMFSLYHRSACYGFVFGTPGLLNMSEYLKICWKLDPLSGESNCRWLKPMDEKSKISSSDLSNKQQAVKQEFAEMVLQGKIDDQRGCVDFAISRGFVFSFFAKVIDDLVEQKKVRIVGVFNAKTINRNDINGFLIKPL